MEQVGILVYIMLRANMLIQIILNLQSAEIQKIHVQNFIIIIFKKMNIINCVQHLLEGELKIHQNI